MARQGTNTVTTSLSRSGRVYVACVITAGAVVVGHSLVRLWQAPVNYQWFVLACLTLLSGSFTIRIPTIPARLSVSETFVFAAVLLFGPEAATVVVVLDTLVISLWLDPPFREPRRILFNVSATAVAISLAANLFYGLAEIQPLSESPQQILGLVIPLFALALCYFVFNSGLVAVAVAFEKQAPAFTIWRQNFLWLSLNYFSGASVAALLLPYLQEPDSPFIRIIGVILPLLLISYLTFKTALGRVEDANSHLRQLNRLYLSTIETLAMAIDAKDQITHGHIRRVQLFAVRLAKAMGVTDAALIQAIEAAALLHDMGKLAVPEYILNKPGPLSHAEFEKMKLHASVGADILSAIEFPYPVVPIVRHHHENWDGSGYPAGLTASEIPIGARILSVVDCFDALTSDRPYRPRLSDRDALNILVERRGRMYDPLVVDKFVEIHPQLRRLSDTIPITEVAPHLSESPKSPDSEASRARLEQIAASRSETMALLQLAQDLSSAGEADQTASVALSHTRRLIPCSLAVVFVKSQTSEDLEVLAHSGDNAAVVSQLRVELGHRLSGWVAANCQSIRNSDAVLDLGEIVKSFATRPRSALAVPIVGTDLVGVLTLYSATENGFTDDHERIAEAIANQLANPLRIAMNAGKYLRSAGTGTVVPTATAAIYVYLAPANGQSIAQWPHDVVEGLIQRIRECVRTEDSVLRIHPDEYVVFLATQTQPPVSSMMQRITTAVAKWCKEVTGKNPREISAGLSVAPADGNTPELLWRSAKARATKRSETSDPAGRSVH